MESRITRHEPLYLKYRPQSLGQLVGQEAVTRTLTNAINFKRLTHAYLFTGPRGTGKTSSARILAKSLNCEESQEPTVTPCQQCGPCKEITTGISPAVMEIDAASNNSVDDARLLIERAPLKAVGGRNKIYIIDECHMLTKEAFNALLKTIEQPPPDVVFILATTEEHKVLPTIISRCQRLMFRNVEQKALTAHLRKIADIESIEIEDEALRVIARRSGGGLRDALSTLDQSSLLGAPGQPVSVNDLLRLMGALHEDTLLSVSEKIFQRDGHGLLQSMSTMLAEGREPSVLAREIAAHFLNLTKASYLAGGHNTSLDDLRSVVLGSDQYLEGLLAQAPKFEKTELSQIIEALDTLETTCRRTTQPTMHLEMGLLGICHRHDMLLVRELSNRVAKLEAMIQEGGSTISARNESPAAARPAERSAPRQVASTETATPGVSGSGFSAGTAHGGANSSPARPQPAEQPRPPAAGDGSGHGVATSQSPVPAQSVMHQSAPPVSPEPLTASGSAQAASGPPPAQQSASYDHASQPDGQVFSHNSPDHDAAGASGGSSIDDVEYVWSRILDELHRINIPTHGFFNSKVAFLLDMNDDEMVFGVKTPNFQKTLEQKSNHLKSACKAVIGKELNIRVKIAASDAKPVVANNAGARRPSSAPANDGYNSHGAAPSTSSAASHSAVTVTTMPGSLADTSSIGGTGGDGTVEFENGAVKEAYKLFEGPGSRRIQ